MKINPINGRVVVKPVEGKDKTPGGIYIPETAKEKQLNEGKVIAVAEDATDEVAVGDHVVYKEFGGTQIEVGGEDLVLLTEDDLVGKYEEADSIPE